MQITAYAALKAGDDLSRLEFELAELKSSDVLIKVQACGLSYSDLNMIDNDWFCSTYPIVPGHEVVGVVEAVGCDVVTHAVGEKVGLGWHRSFCNKCEFCLSDEPHLCAQAERTIIDGHGGFASHVVGHERAVIKIPEGLSPEFAAPLMSAGVAVFDPLLAFSIKRSAHVAIIGAGGLGHLAIQFYKAWGCTVTVFTQDISQAAALESLGADKVVSSVDDMAVLDCLNSFEFILSTVNKTVEWGSFMACLKPKGRLHFVGLPLEHLELGIFPLVSKQRCISGSQSGSPQTIKIMLDYAVFHNIKPVIAEYPHQKINIAVADLRGGLVEYRAVINCEDCVGVNDADEVVS